MNSPSLRIAVVFLNIVAGGSLALAAQAGMGGALPGGDDNWTAPPTAAPANPPKPNPPSPTPAPTPAPNPANAELAKKLAQLRELIEQRQSLTLATIEPLPTLAEIRRQLRLFRARVDRAERQPFLSGVKPPPDLLQGTGAWQDRWGDLGDAIRAGRPPAALDAPTLARLKLAATDAPAAAGSTRMSGALWAAMSNEYFAETHALETLAERANLHVRHSERMRELTLLMGEAEARLDQIRRTVPDPEEGIWRRELTWRLHRVWQLGAGLQARRIEQEMQAAAGEQALGRFLQSSDAARNLRHRGLSLTHGGGAPVAPNATPALLVEATRGATLRARAGGREASVSVDAAPPNRLAELAAELYHVHYLLPRVEKFEAGGDGRDRPQRIAARQRDYEGRRLQLVHEITQETDRVLPGGR